MVIAEAKVLAKAKYEGIFLHVTKVISMTWDDIMPWESKWQKK